MLVQPANFLILDEPTNHLDVQSQEVLQNALIDYEGTVIIVSHNRSFLDPLVTKTLEFRPDHDPRPFAGNITYYLEKTTEEQEGKAQLSGTQATKSSASAQPSSAGGANRKEQRKQEALKRQQRTQLLKPLETELEALEKVIAELEGAQATLTAALSSEEISSDPDKLQQTANAVAQITEKLETSYSRWGSLSDEIEKVQAKLGD